ncbi:retrovirus-related pol polyprotein from transposon TNT 1-94 [Tanacetum coccineum]
MKKNHQSKQSRKKAQTKSPYVPDPSPDKKADSSTEQLLLTLIKEEKGLKEQIKPSSKNSLSVSQTGSFKSIKRKQKTRFGPCKHHSFKNHLSEDCYNQPKCFTCQSTDHLTKEHHEQVVVKNTLYKLKAQSSVATSLRKALKILKPCITCKYCGFCDHHSDECEYCMDVTYVVAWLMNPLTDYLKRFVWYLDSGCSRHMTEIKKYLHKYSKELGPKVEFGDNINQLCDANFKVLFTKTLGTIFNQNNEVVLIAPRRIDVYVIDMSSYNEESNTCFFAKMENHNEVRVKELRSDNKTKFRNHKVEEFCNKKGISQNFSSPCAPEQNLVAERRYKTLIEAARTIDHLRKFDEKADDDFFLGYSLVAKTFRVFNIRKQEMEETYHVTFNEAAEVITQTNTEGDEINFNGNRSFPDDEILVPRNPSQSITNDDFLPYVLSFDPLSTNNIIIPNTIISSTLNINSSDESSELLVANNHHV